MSDGPRIPMEKAEAFMPSRTGRPTRVAAYDALRTRITVALRELRHEGKQIFLRDIARLVGAPNHSTVVGRCQLARRLGLITESELRTLRNGGAERATA